MKLSGNRLRMSDGSIRRFKSAEARDRFERVANMVKAGVKLRVNHGNRPSPPPRKRSRAR